MTLPGLVLRLQAGWALSFVVRVGVGGFGGQVFGLQPIRFLCQGLGLRLVGPPWPRVIVMAGKSLSVKHLFWANMAYS